MVYYKLYTLLVIENLNVYHARVVYVDFDSSGTVSVGELGVLCARMFEMPEGELPNDEDLKFLIESVDVDASGALNLQEFLKLMALFAATQISEENLTSLTA